MALSEKDYVIVRFNRQSQYKTDHGKIKIWREYGQAWGSPIYDVLTYCTGTFADATALAHTYREDDA